MKKFLVIILVFCAFLSCTSNTIYEKPKDLIPRDSMIPLLKDLYLASAAKNIKNSQLQRRFSYAPLVYQKYQIDSNRFQRSNLYYTSKIDLYEPILKEVLASLEKDRALYSKLKKERDSLKQDSLKNARRNLRKKRDTSFRPAVDLKGKELKKRRQ